MTRAWVIALFAIVAVASSSCGHTSDAKLEGAFHDHYQDLSEVVTMLRQDSEVSGISDDFLYARHESFPVLKGTFIRLKGRPPVTAERLARYQELRKRIGMRGPILRNGDEVELDFDPLSFWTGRKGFQYWYSPRELKPLVPSLDRARRPQSTSTERRHFFAYKSIGSGWYLFLYDD